MLTDGEVGLIEGGDAHEGRGCCLDLLRPLTEGGSDSSIWNLSGKGEGDGRRRQRGGKKRDVSFGRTARIAVHFAYNLVMIIP